MVVSYFVGAGNKNPNPGKVASALNLSHLSSPQPKFVLDWRNKYNKSVETGDITQWVKGDCYEVCEVQV